MTENKDNWLTPDPLYEDRTNYYKVYPKLDVCADKYNTKCINYITKEQNALNTEWILDDKSVVDVWCNAQGSNIQGMLDRAYNQWIQYNMNVIMLIPINTISNTGFEKYWNKFKMNEVKIDPLFGIRPKFLDGRTNPEKPLIPKYGSRNGYMSMLFPKK